MKMIAIQKRASKKSTQILTKQLSFISTGGRRTTNSSIISSSSSSSQNSFLWDTTTTSTKHVSLDSHSTSQNRLLTTSAIAITKNSFHKNNNNNDSIFQFSNKKSVISSIRNLSNYHHQASNGDADDDDNNNGRRTNTSSNINHHKLFEEQLLELEEERTSIFGKDSNDNNNNNNNNNNNSPGHQGNEHPPFHAYTTTTTNDVTNDATRNSNQQQEETMQIIGETEKQEREALFNFTMEEKSAWSNLTSSSSSCTNNDENNKNEQSSSSSSSSGGGSSIPIHEQKLSPTLMNAIEHARELQTQQMKKIQQEFHIDDTYKAVSQQQQQQQQQKEQDNEEGIKNDTTTIPSSMDTSTSEGMFTHLNQSGKEVSMVDVGSKKVTRRVAVARSVVVFPPEVMQAFDLYSYQSSSDDDNDDDDQVEKTEIIGPKGPIFATARLAGIMGAKRTSDLIPLCHPLPLEKVNVDIQLVNNTAVIECECRVSHKTGVEMEALAGASIAALTIYDMVKAVSHRVRIEGTELIRKSGGKRLVVDTTTATPMMRK